MEQNNINNNVTTVANLADVTDKSTSDLSGSSKAVHGGDTPIPFVRSVMMQRSPRKVATTSALAFPKSSRMVRSPTKEIRPSTPSLPLLEHDPNLGIASRSDDSVGNILEKRLQTLGSHIEGLQFYVKDRNNVHHEIKRMLRLIKTSFSDLEKEIRCLNIGADVTDKQQNEEAVNLMSNWLLKIQPREMLLDDILSVKTATPSGPSSTSGDSVKRRRDGEGDTSGRTREHKRKRNDATVVNSEKGKKTETNMVTDSEGEQDVNPNEWMKVTTKGKKKKKKRRRGARKRKKSKPDAILVEKRGESTYADILRKVKGDPNLKELGENVARIRRTRDGQMLLELNRGSDKKSADYRELVKTALADQAEVRTLSQEISLECRDLDEVTTKGDIRQALDDFGFKNLNESVIKSIRKAYHSTQIAVISLPADLAYKLLKAGKLKVGWVVCRIRELNQPKRCFRCLEFGHMAKGCTNCDRSKLCWRCGETGHMAKVCQKEPKCMLCTGERGHILGSSRCPLYKREINPSRR